MKLFADCLVKQIAANQIAVFFSVEVVDFFAGSFVSKFNPLYFQGL
jgi:hypothetical protein